MVQHARGRRAFFCRQLVASLALGFFSLVGFSQQVYKWKDAAGTVHYSEKAPPDGAKGIQMNLSAHGGDGLDSSSRSSLPLATTVEDEAALDIANKEQREHLCTVARQNLKMLNSDAMITSDADLDTATQLLGEQRAAKRSEAITQITRNCHGQ